MPTNQQRRETAKRKLERQLERRAKRAEQKRVLMIVAAVVAVLVVIGGAVALIVKPWAKTNTPVSSATTAVPTQDPPATGKLPAFVAPAGLGGNCQYQPTPAEPASKKVNPPRAGTVPTDPAQVSMSMSTNQGNLGLMLDNAKAPCTVNSFVSLAQQGFFNDTPCHRLTAGGVAVLQCGDPSGTGTGGPGYRFANEYPTDQYRPGSPLLDQPVIYPRGTLAMANAGPGTNGSQFFLVYADSQLPPGYTVFGTIDPTGLATLDKIAKGGIKDGGPDGAPATPVTIKSILLD
ncbi:peptidyl-prolyl cis-trans isomerase B (cyclophilin B) [Mycobacterium sp. MAA66]|uniref:peptidylprolyl isomerase n=1 Tax=Mycobacterium sp. MAA66 TaxID=3156297 RepID=UPI00351895F1